MNRDCTIQLFKAGAGKRLCLLFSDDLENFHHRLTQNLVPFGNFKYITDYSTLYNCAMDTIVLTDKNQKPTDDLIFSIVGKQQAFWEMLVQRVKSSYPEALEQWNYYNDGKSWLFRMIRKKKTLFWIGVFSDYFRITFYFGDKAEPLILQSKIPEAMKNDFIQGKRYGKIRAVTLRPEKEEDIDTAMELLAIRVKV